MADEVFHSTTLAGDEVEVRINDNRELVVRVGSVTVLPHWGSQAFDDWLDWIHAQRGGPAVPLPADEPDWLLDDGYDTA